MLLPAKAVVSKAVIEGCICELNMQLASSSLSNVTPLGNEEEKKRLRF